MPENRTTYGCPAAERPPGFVMENGGSAEIAVVGNEGIEGALKLQQAGLIRYARGHITVIDRPGLEERSCEC